MRGWRSRAAAIRVAIASAHGREYDASRRATMILGENSKVEDAPYDGERRAWEVLPTGILGSL